jgi:hypothetical protein
MNPTQNSFLLLYFPVVNSYILIDCNTIGSHNRKRTLSVFLCEISSLIVTFIECFAHNSSTEFKIDCLI